jgi:predicted metal-binding membrane protein
MKALAHRSVFLPVIAALVVSAWLMLWLWERSPYGRYLGHGELAHFDVVASPVGALAQAAAYVGGWTLMMVAMMLPTTLPLVQIFQRLTRQRADQGRLVAVLLLGYLGVWLAFGVGAHVFDWGLHAAYDRVAWLKRNPWFFSAAVLVVAGAYQFSTLKYRCLDKCRAPFGFVMQHWRSGGAAPNAFRLGAHHGLFCVGCCWALMLLMFAVGTGSVAWMLVLGAVMAIEKNIAWGRKLSSPLGAVLLAWGVLIVVDHRTSWQAWAS